MSLTTQEQINQAVWKACDSFRGTVDPSIYKDYILTTLFLKYISDIYNHKIKELENQHQGKPEIITRFAQTIKFKISPEANFSYLYEHRKQAGNGTRFDKAFASIEENNPRFQGIFQDISFNSNKLGDGKQKNQTLQHLLEDFNAIDLTPEHMQSADIIGNAYEYLIKQFAASSGKAAGEFYTPPEVSDLLAILLDPQPGAKICDPACGSGSLLMKCGKQIQKNHNSKHYELHGQEAIGSTWSLAKMNMLLHGEDNHRLEWGDTIRNPLLLDKHSNLELFDIVTANPPFSLDKWGVETAESDSFHRFNYGIPPKTKGDYAFICHMLAILKNTGRMGVVVPHGVLFRAAAEGKIRKQLIEGNLLDTVIGLPEKLFFGTGIPAAILIFNKAKQDDKVLFIDASREFKSGKNQNQLTQANINKIVTCYKERKTTDKYSYLANLAEIQENDYNLNIPRYVDTFEEEAEIDLTAVRAERLQLQQQLADLETEMAGYLKELGYEGA